MVLNLKYILKRAKQLNVKRFLVQIPEGLKPQALDIVDQLERAGFDVFLSCEPTYGGCDILDCEAARLGCQAILHIGHSDFGIKSAIPIIYDEWRFAIDPRPTIKANLSKLKEFKKIALFTTLQYIESLTPAKKFLQSKGIKVLIGTPSGNSMPGKARYQGQILGCDFSSVLALEKIVDGFLYIGTGMFHPLGLVTKTEKPVLFLDFDTGRLTDISKERERLIKIRAANIEAAKGLKRFGILLCTKSGQTRVKAALDAKKKLEKIGKKAWILTMADITPDKITGMDIEVIVNTACPRLTEDVERFGRPILDPDDIDKLAPIKTKAMYE
jgi:2-(3-amino-3-carboxypropyl)histidine synthase